VTDDLRLAAAALLLVLSGCSSKVANVAWCANWEDRYAGIQSCANNPQCRLDVTDMTLAKRYERACSLETTHDQ